jgi:hypothetical protein
MRRWRRHREAIAECVIGDQARKYVGLHDFLDRLIAELDFIVLGGAIALCRGNCTGDLITRRVVHAEIRDHGQCCDAD